jgi:putative hydrolase
MEKIEYMINNRKYCITSDLHTHTTFSHGTGSIEANVLAARARGIHTVGITDHGPGHITYGVKRWNIPKMRAEVDRLSMIYTDMDIQLGIEANVINGTGILDVRPDEFYLYDYVIAGYHYAALGVNLVGNGLRALQNLAENKTGKDTRRLMRKNTQSIVRAIERNQIKILTHPGDKAPVDLLEIAVTCAKYGTLVEINTNHMSLTAEDIKTMALTDVRFIICSDAHAPNRVGDFVSGVNLALDAGIDMGRIVNLKIS